MLITIDGTSGTGKSSVGDLFATKHSFLHLNSGLYYRAITSISSELNAVQDLESLLEAISFRIQFLTESILIDGSPVEVELLKSDRISHAGVMIARIPEIRSLVNKHLRENALGKNTIVEGRNIGIEVFPDANFKFFLECSPEVTAQRMSRAMNIPFEKALHSIQLRDEKDKSRAVSPVVIPEDAIRIDTSDLTIPQTLERIEKYVFG